MSDSATPWWVVAKQATGGAGGQASRAVSAGVWYTCGWPMLRPARPLPAAQIDRPALLLALLFLAVKIHDAGPRRVVDDLLRRCNTA